jgi:hypothetical protein
VEEDASGKDLSKEDDRRTSDNEVNERDFAKLILKSISASSRAVFL